MRVKPLVGAGLPIVTVPIALAPPTKLAGDIAILDSVGARTFNEADCWLPLPAAAIETVVSTATRVVAILNVAVVFPAAMLVLAGTVAAGLLLVSVTVKPLGGATVLNIIVPVAEAEPISVVGAIVIEAMATD